MSEKEYDFDNAKQGAIIQPLPETTQVTLRIDNEVLEWFRQRVHKVGGGNYQTLMNAALREYIQDQDNNLEKTLRRVIREELQTIVS